MADRRNLVFPLVFFLWIVLSPDPRPPAAQLQAQKRIHDVIAQEQHSLQVLQNSTYQDQPIYGPGNSHALNLTGLEPDRGYAWDLLPRVKERFGQQLNYALGDWGLNAVDRGDNGFDPPPIYHNVTGQVFGDWVRSKVPPSVPHLNLSTYTPQGPFGPFKPRPFTRNITATEGGISLEFYERSEQDMQRHGLQNSNATRLNAEIKLESDDGSEDFSVLLRGVYFHDIGQAYLTSHSEKFDGIFMLPHLTLSQRTFEEAKAVMNDSISRTIQSQIEGRSDYIHPWSTSGMEGDTLFPSPACELVLYLQQLPPSWKSQPYSFKFLSFLERELRFPTGVFLPQAPDMSFSMLAFSPDCGYVIESKGEPDYPPQLSGNHLSGSKIQVLHNRGRHHLMFFSVCLALQLALLMNQMREACTPSTRSKVSFYTVAMLALGDGFCTMSFCVTSLFISTLWINLVGTAFLSFLSVSFFGMRFLMDIWTVQAPERARQERERIAERRRRFEEFRNSQLNRASQPPGNAPQHPPQTSSVDDVEGENAEASLPPRQPSAMPGGLPLPVTSRPTATDSVPVFMPSDQEGLEPVQTEAAPTRPAALTGTTPEPQMTSFGALYTRFYLLLLGTLFVSLNAASWPTTYRRLYFNLLALIYLGFWLPQIYRNVQRNCRKALLWKYVAGQSVLRLSPFAYFYAYKHNILFAAVDYKSLALLTVWVWLQVLFLISQDIIGPRWFIKSGWAPPAYDYHPILRLDEEGATLPLGASQVAGSLTTPSSPVQERRRSSVAEPSSPVIARRGSIAKETKERGKRVFDCAICMQDLEVPVIEADAGRANDGGGGSSGSAASLLARRNYMVTPCRHIFHSSCLEGWMKYRLQCPNCREGLPPL